MKEQDIMQRLLADARTSVHYDITPSVLVEFEHTEGGKERVCTMWLHSLSLHQRYGTWVFAGSEYDPTANGPLGATKGKHLICCNVNIRSVVFYDQLATPGALVCEECGKRFNDDQYNNDKVLCGSIGNIYFCATKEPF